MLGLVIGMLIECKLKSFALSRFHKITDMEGMHSHLTHVKLLSSILISFLVTRDCIIYRHFGCFIGLIDKLVNKSTTICLSDRFGSNMVRKVVKFVSTCIPTMDFYCQFYVNCSCQSQSSKPRAYEFT